MAHVTHIKLPVGVKIGDEWHVIGEVDVPVDVQLARRPGGGVYRAGPGGTLEPASGGGPFVVNVDSAPDVGRSLGTALADGLRSAGRDPHDL